MSSVVNVILSGGVGSRLWPLSRKSKPKQYIPLSNGKTLFQLCAARNKELSDRILVVGNKDNFQLSRDSLNNEQIPNFSEIVEAVPRNTAAAIAFAAFATSPNDILLVTPSDHMIYKEEEYKNCVSKALQLANGGFMVTFGIRPTKPETGFGYIEYQGEDVLSFKEKPSLPAALEYCQSGKFLWNSGMFCFKASTFLKELQQFEPEIYRTSLEAWKLREGIFLGLEPSMRIPSKSVDYAVMERSDKIKVIESALDWSDLGSFDALWDFMDKTEQEKGRKNLILGSKKHVEILGLENIIFVETDDAILVMPRDKSQDVKAVYEKLEKIDSSLIK